MLEIARMILWPFGAKRLLLRAAHRFIKKAAPSVLRLRRRLLPDMPKWLAPDVALRNELKLRREEYAAKKQKSSAGSRYLQEGRIAFDHPLISWDLEEYFNVYGRNNLRLLQPYWDPDLVEWLDRTPQFMLNHGGRNKELVRAWLAGGFPTIGLDSELE